VPHFTYYEERYHLSFIWDGVADHVEVCLGGYGEPVIDTIPLHSMPPELSSSEWMAWFMHIGQSYVQIHAGGRTNA